MKLLAKNMLLNGLFYEKMKRFSAGFLNKFKL